MQKELSPAQVAGVELVVRVLNGQAGPGDTHMRLPQIEQPRTYEAGFIVGLYGFLADVSAVNPDQVSRTFAQLAPLAESGRLDQLVEQARGRASNYEYYRLLVLWARSPERVGAEGGQRGVELLREHRALIEGHIGNDQLSGYFREYLGKLDAAIAVIAALVEASVEEPVVK